MLWWKRPTLYVWWRSHSYSLLWTSCCSSLEATSLTNHPERNPCTTSWPVTLFSSLTSPDRLSLWSQSFRDSTGSSHFHQKANFSSLSSVRYIAWLLYRFAFTAAASALFEYFVLQIWVSWKTLSEKPGLEFQSPDWPSFWQSRPASLRSWAATSTLERLSLFSQDKLLPQVQT